MPPPRFRVLVPAIVALFAISAAIRWSWRDDAVVSNIDASYHVLLTVEAMNQTPVAVHRLLPIATLGRSFDRDVKFGAAVRGDSGIYYTTRSRRSDSLRPGRSFDSPGWRQASSI